MVQLFEGQKHWHCRVCPTKDFELFITNNAKVTVGYAASHFLGSRLERDKRAFEGGIFMVLIRDLADQVDYEVTIQRFVEEGHFGKRVRSEVKEVKNV